MLKKIIYFWPIILLSTLFFVGCAQHKPQSYTIACDANGSPVLVTEN